MENLIARLIDVAFYIGTYSTSESNTFAKTP